MSTNAGGVFTYDANGNMLTRKTTSAAPVQTLAWSPANELLSVTTGATVESYRYDADGQRIYQESKTSGNFTWQHFDYFPHYTVGVTTTQAITKTYFFGGQPIAQKVGGKPLTYLHADHLGSTVLTTGVGGSAKYHAYGALRSGGVQSDYQFTGQELDKGTGLIYMQARYYDPVIGQFISPDTVVPDPNNLYAYNRYMYAYGNPLKLSDPSGHCATLEDGSPDMEGDPRCWQLFDELWKSWNADPSWWEKRFPMTRDEFMAQFAYNETFDDQWMGDQLQAFWGPQYQQWSVYHPRYNSAPQMHATPPVPFGYASFVDDVRMTLGGCAASVGGICGMGRAWQVVAPGGGMRGALDGYIDQNGNVAIYATVAAGPAIAVVPSYIPTRGNTITVAPGASLEDMGGWSLQIGGTAAAGGGLAVDMVLSTSGPLAGSVGLARGTMLEVHTFLGYSYQLYSSAP